MNKTSKKVAALALSALTAVTCLSATACSQTVADDEQTLEIYIGNFGYGVEWLDAEIDAFKQESWVKEKYPNLNIPTPQSNSDTGYATNRIIAGERANSIDLFFVASFGSASYFEKKDSKGNHYFEELSDLYKSTVPGENITYEEKLRGDNANIQYVELLDGSHAYYGAPWVDGSMGLLYNKTLVADTLGSDYEAPVTTDKLVQMAEDLKKEEVVPFISASKVQYWSSMQSLWWAQYEGVDGIDRYYRGLNEYDELSNEIFSQKGRLRSLQVLESLISADKGNLHDEVNTMEFTVAQSRFLLGQGAMMPNGDWFENEMRAVGSDVKGEIVMMKTPVISSIIEKCTTIENDEELAALVRAVDAGSTALEGTGYSVNQADYDKVYEARNIVNKLQAHEAYIPAYATAKDVAKDFLLFLATDKGINIFMKETTGASTPFQYNVKEKDEALYNSFTSFQRERLDNYETCVRMKPSNAYRLVNFGGLTTYIKTSNIEVSFTAKNKADRKTAQEIYDADVKYYTTGGGTNWQSILTNAGLA